MKIALYLRVSSDIQDYNRQETELTAKALSDGKEIAYIFNDKISGFKDDKDRPDLNKMLQLTSDEIQEIYISELSRLSRNPTYLKILIDRFTEKGINIYSYSQNINTLNREGRTDFMTSLLISILSEYSAYEITLRNFRVKSGKNESITKRGNSYTNKPPFGYKLTGDSKNRKLEIDEVESKIVKNIFTMASKSTNLVEIAQYLNLNKISTRNIHYVKKDYMLFAKTRVISKSDIKWTTTTIRSLLKNTVYCGYKDLLGIGRITTPSIISERLFIKCNARIKNRITYANLTKRNFYILKGLVFCGICGKSYLGIRMGHVYTYTCADKTHKGSITYLGCNNRSIGRIALESMIWSVIKKRYINYRKKALLEADLVKSTELITESKKQIAIAEKRKTELVKESARLLDQQVKGLYDPDLIDKKQEAIVDETTLLNKAINRYSFQIDYVKKTILNRDPSYCQPFDITEIEKDYDKRKLAINELVSEISVYRAEADYIVIKLDYQNGHTNYIIRRVYRNNFLVLDSHSYKYDKSTGQFLCNKITPSGKDFFYRKPNEIFEQATRKNLIEKIVPVLAGK